MPGLFGLVTDNSADLGCQLQRMARALQTGFEKVSQRWSDEAGGVGFGRESVGIFNPQPQPAFNQTGNLALVMDGHFYQTEQLRDRLNRAGVPCDRATEPELALHVFEQEGPEGVARLQGIFVLAVWNNQAKQLVLVNDRFGLRPLYYTHRPGLFAFSGEVKGLLALKDFRPTVDDHAVADFFSFEQIIGDKTFFSEIRLLPPASIFSLQDGKLAQRNYWKLEFMPPDQARPEEEWVEEMVERLTRAVEIRVEEKYPVGLPLSGGIDSRLLLAVLSGLGVAVPTYTYGLKQSKDLVQACRLSNAVGVPHHVLAFEDDYISKNAGRVIDRGDGMLTCTASHGFVLQAMTAQCRVMMLGNGGDSFFWAYRSYLKPGEEKLLEGEPNFFPIINFPFKAEVLPDLFTAAYFSRIEGRAQESLRTSLAGLSPNTPDNLLDCISLRELERRYTFQGLFTINHFIEYTEPYYDYDLVDFALKVPLDMRWDRKIQNLALIKLSPTLARLAGGPLDQPNKVQQIWQRGSGRVNSVLRRLKIRAKRKPSSSFTDLHSLFRTIDRKWVEEILLSPSTLERIYFKPNAVRKLVEDHMCGQRNLGRQLAALITFELWHRRFVD